MWNSQLMFCYRSSLTITLSMVPSFTKQYVEIYEKSFDIKSLQTYRLETRSDLLQRVITDEKTDI